AAPPPPPPPQNLNLENSECGKRDKAPEKEKSRRKSTGLYFEWIKFISELQVNFQPLSELSYRYTNT
ncbi:hypothetical protein, partial [Chryseobacterium sp. EO14]|uniref:hypothetical protein n=1 Tax=Chryseobacterium sp. EO14 TaxID=2950551 RepID=UPI00210A5025